MSEWQATHLSAILVVCQKAVWQAEHWLLRPACEVIPPNGAPALALSEPGLKSMPPRIKPTTTTARMVNKAVIKPEIVRQPNGFFFMVLPLARVLCFRAVFLASQAIGIFNIISHLGTQANIHVNRAIA
jgi:hypothetical protein